MRQLIQEGKGDPADSPLHDGVGFPFNKVEVEVGVPEEIDSGRDLLGKRHRSKITNPGSGIQGSDFLHRWYLKDDQASLRQRQRA